MFVSLWIGVVLAGGEPAVSSPKNANPTPAAVSPHVPALEVRTAVPRNSDYYQIPKVPPPGVKVTYNSVPLSEPYVAITFDDGPHATNTPRLLDMLQQRNIKATFYVVGKCVQEYPQIVRRILGEGHEMGNHSWSHNALSGMSLEKAHAELAKTHQAVLEVSGYQMRTMRPPYGATNLRVKQLSFEQFGYPTIIWSIDPFDWKKPGASVVEQRIVAGAHPGAIILVHDIHEATINAMPGTLDTLLSKGYRFVTVSQLLNLGAIAAATPPPPVTPAPTAPTTITPAAAAAAVTAPTALLPTGSTATAAPATAKVPAVPTPTPAAQATPVKAQKSMPAAPSKLVPLPDLPPRPPKAQSFPGDPFAAPEKGSPAEQKPVR